MKHYLTFGDVDSRDYNVWIAPQETDSAPQREYSEIVIAGRNGTLIMDEGRYQNVEQMYTGVICSDTRESDLIAFRNDLSARIGYQRLGDSVHPDEFYEARFMEVFEPTFTQGRNASKFDLKFNRKPQRFLISGEEAVAFTGNGNITNPTKFASEPLIKVTGYGTLGIGDRTVIITGNAGQEIYIDCEIMEAWEQSGNVIIPRNDHIQYVGQNFPRLESGENGISMSGTITKIELTPRWWRL